MNRRASLDELISFLAICAVLLVALGVGYVAGKLFDGIGWVCRLGRSS